MRADLYSLISILYPLDSVALGFSLLAEEWERPVEGRLPEYLLPVLHRADVVEVGLAGRLLAPLPLQVVECGAVLKHQLDVELEEQPDHDHEAHQHDVPGDAHDGVHLEQVRGRSDGLRDLVDQQRSHEAQGHEHREDHVEEEEQEELAVPVAHAVGDPGAVVVHVEHALLAGGAVVAPESQSNYLSGLKPWHIRQYLRFLDSFSSRKKPQ